jgi:hypothetical protein
MIGGFLGDYKMHEHFFPFVLLDDFYEHPL